MSELIKINKLEVASELAEMKLINDHGGKIKIFVETEDEVRYTDKAQDIFNVYYDEYLTFLEKYKV